LATLPSHLREVLILVGASGYTCEEAAAICQVEIATIQSRLNSARLKLITLLDL
jgi:RNA polymerase sigma-70 factor (ECF subfamily)